MSLESRLTASGHLTTIRFVQVAVVSAGALIACSALTNLVAPRQNVGRRVLLEEDVVTSVRVAAAPLIAQSKRAKK